MIAGMIVGSVAAGGLSAAVAVVALDAGALGSLLAYWIGGMAGALLLLGLAGMRYWARTSWRPRQLQPFSRYRNSPNA